MFINLQFFLFSLSNLKAAFTDIYIFISSTILNILLYIQAEPTHITHNIHPQHIHKPHTKHTCHPPICTNIHSKCYKTIRNIFNDFTVINSIITIIRFQLDFRIFIICLSIQERNKQQLFNFFYSFDLDLKHSTNIHFALFFFLVAEFAHGGQGTPRTIRTPPLIPQQYYPLLNLKTSPVTSPIATPIKFEHGSVMDENELRIDSGRNTPTHCILHRGRHGNNGDNEDSNNNNDDEDENDDDSRDKPFDLRMGIAKVLLAAAHAPGGIPMGHHTQQHSHSHHSHQQQLQQQTRPQLTQLMQTSPDRRYSSSSSLSMVPVTAAAAAAAVAAAAGMPSNSGGGSQVDSKAAMAAAVAAVAANNTSASAGGGVGGASTSAAAAAAAAAAAGLVPSNTAGSGSWAGSGLVSGSGGSGSGGGAGGAYACDRCGNTYARPHSLNRHVRFECGVEPQFECPICHKKSKHKHNLVLHMRTHQHR